MQNIKLTVRGFAFGASLVAVLAMSAGSALAKPKVSTVKGKVIDLTCAAKGRAMQGKWVNVNEDHMMGPGKTMKGCATMCLKGGQPAALFAKGKIVATFACNPRATLSKYAAQNVEIQGMWAGIGGGTTFIPQKIRKAGSGAWANVNCATMHK